MTTELKLSTDLIELAEPNALDTFSKPEEVDRIVALLRERIDASVANLRDVGLYDASTDEGRAAIRSLAHKITKSRTGLEKIGEDVTRELKALPNKVIAGKNKFTEEINKIQAFVRKPLTDYEERDEKRKADHVAAIETIKGYAVPPFGADVETLRGLLAAAESVSIGPECEEFRDGYEMARQAAVEALGKAVDTRIKHDADQAELAQLREKQRIADEQAAEQLKEAQRKEREEQIAKKAAEDAARKAQEEAAAREAEIKRQNDAEQRRLNDEITARDAEKKRVADAKAAEEVEARRREASTLNRKKVGAEAASALMLKVQGMTEAMALDVVRAIAKKEIPHLMIEW